MIFPVSSIFSHTYIQVYLLPLYTKKKHDVQSYILHIIIFTHTLALAREEKIYDEN